MHTAKTLAASVITPAARHLSSGRTLQVVNLSGRTCFVRDSALTVHFTDSDLANILRTGRAKPSAAINHDAVRKGSFYILLLRFRVREALQRSRCADLYRVTVTVSHVAAEEAWSPEGNVTSLIPTSVNVAAFGQFSYLDFA